MVIGIDASRAFVSERTGTENYSWYVITQLLALPEAKKHTFILFTRPKPLIQAEVKRENVLIKEINHRYLWTQVGLAKATWGNKLDVLWVPAHTLPILRNPAVKTVVTIHGLEYKWLPEYHNLLQRWYLPLSTYYAACKADRIICVSDNTRDTLVKELRERATLIWRCKGDFARFRVILEGVESKKEKLITEAEQTKLLVKYGLKRKKYLLFIGTLQPRKNLPALITAFAKVGKELADYKLVISGSKGWQSKAIFEAAIRSGREERVVFTGRISEEVKKTLLNNASIYVQPSLTEGFALPLLEAMQSHVPVICTDGGAMPQVAGEAAVVVTLGDGFANRLTKAIAKLAGDLTLQKKLVRAGSERVGELSWEKVAKETLNSLVSL